MNNTNWDLFKCRCSAISKMLSNKRGCEPLTEKQTARRKELECKGNITEKQKEELATLILKDSNSKKEENMLSDTCIEYLMEAYAWETKGIVSVRKEMDVLQFRMGRLAENESITLLSVVDGVIYSKNEERIYNNFLSGIPDVFLGEEIMAAEEIIDAKSTDDYPLFLKKINQGLENGQEEQVQGYIDITGAKKGWIANCLPNTPMEIMNDYKRKLLYRMNVISEESPEFKEAWHKLERSMVFDDIPPFQRVYKIPIEPFTEFQKKQVYDRVKVCREWLWKFDEVYQNLNKIAEPQVL